MSVKGRVKKLEMGLAYPRVGARRGGRVLALSPALERSSVVAPPIYGVRPRLREGACAAMVALLVATGSVASASEPEAVRPATWDMTLEELQAIGLGQSRGEPESM